MQHVLPIIEAVPENLPTRACPACQGARAQVFFDLPSLPVNCISLWPTDEEARSCPRGDIRLAFCPDCGAIFNQAFDSRALEYDNRYDNSLHFSPSFQRYAEALADGLIERYQLRNKDIIEVGCGKGEFLELLCSRGGNRGLGFDPTYEPGRVDTGAGGGFRVIADYYSDRYTSYPADFLCCRHVLEHIFSPRSFLMDIRRALSTRTRCGVFFEVPNAFAVFRDLGIWDIIYEHCFYYSPGALERLFRASGFAVISTYQTFEGQYLCLEGKPATDAGQREISTVAREEVAEFKRTIERFADDYRERTRYWRGELLALAKSGQRVVLWGAGAKGATFLNALRQVSNIQYIVDINPHKQGMFVPGTGQKVVSPQFLREYLPHLVVISNRNYEAEIKRTVGELGLRPAFQVV